MNATRAACIGLCLCVWMGGCVTRPASWEHRDHSDTYRLQSDEEYCNRVAERSVRKKRTEYEERRKTDGCKDCSFGQSLAYSLVSDFVDAASLDLHADITFNTCMRDLGYRAVEARPASYGAAAERDEAGAPERYETPDAAAERKETGPPRRSSTYDRRKCESDCRSMYEKRQLKVGISIDSCISIVCTD